MCKEVFKYNKNIYNENWLIAKSEFIEGIKKNKKQNNIDIKIIYIFAWEFIKKKKKKQKKTQTKIV